MTTLPSVMSLGIRAVRPGVDGHGRSEAAEADLKLKSFGLTIQSENVVCSANLGLKFDLKEVVRKSGHKAELMPKGNCVVLKTANPNATGALFASGKMGFTGVKDEDDAKTAAKKFLKIIQGFDFASANLMDFKMINAVASCDAGFSILLEEFALAKPQITTYEPELHPALIYQMAKPKVKLLIFASGKVVLTGTRDMNDMKIAMARIYPELRVFQDKYYAIDTSNEAIASMITKSLYTPPPSELFQSPSLAVEDTVRYQKFMTERPTAAFGVDDSYYSSSEYEESEEEEDSEDVDMTSEVDDEEERSPTEVNGEVSDGQRLNSEDQEQPHHADSMDVEEADTEALPATLSVDVKRTGGAEAESKSDRVDEMYGISGELSRDNSEAEDETLLLTPSTSPNSRTTHSGALRSAQTSATEVEERRPSSPIKAEEIN